MLHALNWGDGDHGGAFTDEDVGGGDGGGMGSSDMLKVRVL
jgi:hypothetical protein